MQKAIPDSPRGQGNVAKDRAKCLASMENSPNPTKLRKKAVELDAM